MIISQKTKDIEVFVNVLPGRCTMASMDLSRFVIAFDDFDNRLKISPGTEKGRFRMAYILPASASHEELLQGLSLLNEFDGELCIYCSRQLCDFGKRFNNDHISFCEMEQEEMEVTANAVITYSLQTIYFIKQLIPVFVLGPCGIGGWVTPVNLPFLANSGFMGRPGGLPGEITPLMIWMEELNTFGTCTELQQTLAESKKFVDRLPYIGSSQVQTEVSRREEHCLMERDPHIYWELKPRYCSNIFRVDIDDTVFFKRIEINDTIASIPITYILLLNGIDGQHKTAEIFNQCGLDRDEFIALFDELIEVNVITFYTDNMK